MPITTAETIVSPKDGWVLLATAPAGPITIKPHSTSRSWFLAIAAALPPKTLLGLPFGRFSSGGDDNQFTSAANIAENIYVRVPDSSTASADAIDNSMIFTVVKG